MSLWLTLAILAALPGGPSARNVVGEPLKACSMEPRTGFYRDGRCDTGPEDRGVHVVCARMTEAFLAFSKSRGNDLVTPAPQYRFPGLKPGQRWCLCAARFAEAARAGVAPPVVLEATHAAALETISIETLREHRTEPRTPEARSDEPSQRQSEDHRRRP